MKVIPIRSDGIYKKIMKAPSEKKNDIYRYEMMMPFEKVGMLQRTDESYYS
ncbi:MAG: hypothetical protein ACLUUO_07475 [Sellimonas intestinalis]